MDNETKRLLVQRLAEETNVPELLQTLDQLSNGRTEGAFTVSEEIEHLTATLTRIRYLSRGNSTATRKAIFSYLIPLCLRASEDFSERVNLYSSRELLGKWLNDLPVEWYHPIVNECSVLLGQAISNGAVDPACWTIAQIGFRSPELVQILERLIDATPDAVSDPALGTLVDLGNISAHRNRLLEIVHHRAAIELTSGVAYALAALADPRSLPLLHNISRSATPQPADIIHRIISVASCIARRSKDQGVHDHVARLLLEIEDRFGTEIRGLLLIRGDVLPWCDSPVVSGYLCSVLNLVEDGAGKTQSMHSMALNRMTDCWRPAQLEGFNVTLPASALLALNGYLLANDGYAGRSASPLSDLKSRCVTGLLRIGSPELITWFSDILESETSPYTAHDFVNTMSVFRFDKLPFKVTQFITEIVDLPKERDAELILRLSAFRLARSSASEEAFEKLLSPGLRYGGSIMLDTVEALADVALERARQTSQRSHVLSTLFERLNVDTAPVALSSVCRAINGLALAGFLEPRHASQLSEFLLRPTQEDTFEQSQIAQSLGCLPREVIPDDVLGKFTEWGLARNDWLGWRSVEALLKLDLLSAHPELYGHLGLTRDASGWRWDAQSARCNWASAFVILLYGKNRAEFANAVASAILDSNWEASERAALTLVHVCRNRKFALEPVIGEALTKRAKLRNRPNSSDLAIFSFLSLISPATNAKENWMAVWDNWTSDARATLADSLASAAGEAELVPFASLTVIQMLDDVHFGVRRAAARTLSRLDSGAFIHELSRRAVASNMNERTRAAEMLSELDESADNDATSRALLNDPIKKVRDAAQTGLGENDRKHLAHRYLEKILALEDPSNNETLGVIKYVQSLADIGDDETLSMLSKHLREKRLPSRVRHLLGWLYTELEKEWRKRRQKWPEALVQVQGSVFSGRGRLILSDRTIDVRYEVWTAARDGTGTHFHWGGEIFFPSDQYRPEQAGTSARLSLEDNRDGSIYIDESLISSNSNEVRLYFSGASEYPHHSRTT